MRVAAEADTLSSPGATRGRSRMGAHSMLRSAWEGVEAYLRSQDLEFDEPKQKEVQMYRNGGNRVNARTSQEKVSPKDLGILSTQGNKAAQLWQKLLRSSEAQQMLVGEQPQRAVLDQKAVQRLHSLQLIHNHHSFNSVANEMTRIFFHELVPDYTTPSRTQVAAVLEATAVEISESVQKHVREKGP